MAQKTDEQRAERWADYSHPYSRSERANVLSAYIAGIRSERRQMRKEIGEVLGGLLKAARDEYRKSDYDPDIGYYCDGITASMDALKIKVAK